MAGISTQLSELAKTVPQAIASAGRQATGQANVQMQQQLGAMQMPVGLGMADATTALALQQQQRATQIALATQQQQQQTLTQLAEQGLRQQAEKTEQELQTKALQNQQALEQQQRAAQMKAFQQETAARKQVTEAEITTAQRVQAFGLEQDNKLLFMSVKQRQDLAKAGRDVKERILDAQLRFSRDEMGRKFTQERQLAAFKVTQLQKDIDLTTEMQQMEQMYDRKIQLLQTINQRIATEMTREFAVKDQKLEFEHKAYLADLKRKMDDKIKAESGRKRNWVQAWTAVGTIVGGVVAGVYSLGIGAAGGAAVGGAVGTGIGTATSDAVG